MSHHDPLPLYVQDRITHKHEGFPKLDYSTSLRAGKGPSGALLFSLVGVVMVIGFGIAGYTQNKKAATELDKKKRQLVIGPLLQAEADRRFMNAYKAKLSEEEAVMKDVPGWVVGESIPQQEMDIPY